MLGHGLWAVPSRKLENLDFFFKGSFKESSNFSCDAAPLFAKRSIFYPGMLLFYLIFLFPYYILTTVYHAGVAQRVEQDFRKVQAGGSSPLIGSNSYFKRGQIAILCL